MNQAPYLEKNRRTGRFAAIQNCNKSTVLERCCKALTSCRYKPTNSTKVYSKIHHTPCYEPSKMHLPIRFPAIHA